jgi:hypothetical protein
MLLPLVLLVAPATGLDQVAMLSAPKFNSSQPDVLKSAVSRARLLQKHLDAIRARMQRIQVRRAVVTSAL